ncbi:MAG: Hsp70 family protein [Leptolyngbya sp. DLM2.Bin15]|nr:MAG: Hsp70 family protein [Leptolyngbya sp. DLM2.Bin15]
MSDTLASTYAIDFGTSNTVIARWNPATQQAETVKLPALSQVLPNNPPVIPSLVYVDDARLPQILLGQTVRDRGLDIAQDSRFFRNFKRGIGAGTGFLPELDGCPVTLEQVGQWYLQHLIRQLQTQDPSLRSLTVTVPVDSFESYRHWLGQVCQTVDLEQVRLLDEPTAAALGYGLGDRSTMLVIDAGGGTLDLAVVKLETPQTGDRKPLGFLLKWGSKNLAETSSQRPQLARVLAKSGQNLGGADIDDWLVAHFAETQGLPISSLTLRLAERLKIQLSSQEQASEVYFNDETLESYELHLDRDRFRQILEQHHLFERLDDALNQVLRQARRQGLEPGDIDAVLLVGGTARIPALRDWVIDQFSAEKVQSDRPFEAIAHGALQLSQGLEVKDFLYHSYGIRYWDRRANAHGWHPLISQGQPYPMPVPVELLLGASQDNQPSIELVIGELGNETSRTEVFFDGDRLVTRQTSGDQPMVQALNDTEQARRLANLDPPGYPGSDRIRLLFQVDGDRLLRVTVEDLLTNKILIDNRAVVQLS